MLKYLLIVLVVVLVIWLARAGRRRVPPPGPAPDRTSATPQDMVACAHCGMHLPRDEALPGRGGVFCGEAHRRAYEQTHGAS